MNLHHHQYKSRLPPGVANVIADRKTGDLAVDCEKILNDTMVSIRAVLFRYHASTMSHDMSSVMDHVMDRAREVTEEDLHKLVAKLGIRHGSGSVSGSVSAIAVHKATAYAQMCRQLVADVETAVFDQNKQRVDTLQQEKIFMKGEAMRVHSLLGRDLALKEQELSRALADRHELEERIKALLRSNESTKNELEKTLRDQARTHQLAVELRFYFVHFPPFSFASYFILDIPCDIRMQGLDFKAEVDRRCAKVLASISARMGFVPSGIQQTLMKLKVLKAPGDPAYDAVRASTGGHLRYRHVSPTRTEKRTPSPSPPKKTASTSNSAEKAYSKMRFTKGMNNSLFDEQIDTILNAYKIGYRRRDEDASVEDEDVALPHGVVDDALVKEDDLDTFFDSTFELQEQQHSKGVSRSPETHGRLESRIAATDSSGLDSSKQIGWSNWNAKLNLMGKGEVRDYKPHVCT
jgi:hypothetical protein